MSVFINSATAFRTQRFRTAIGPLAASMDTLLHHANGYTVIAKYAPKFLKFGGAGVRLTLQGFVTDGHTATINNLTVALAASGIGAKAWDSDSAPQLSLSTGATA